jgi:undecaprenyl-phosphate 4-deoxy-4-formamido-L-arabinose transferase
MHRATDYPEFVPSAAAAAGPRARVAAPRRSVVIPVYNGAATIGAVVDELFRICGDDLEVVLVNDASTDDSERVCRDLVERHSGGVALIQLSRNAGEQRAVLTGLRYCRGAVAAVIDDDGQQRAEDVVNLFREAESGSCDVVFGRYVRRRHPWHRRLVSRLHNVAACRLFGKPPGLYLSSFKVLNRYLIDRLGEVGGPFLHIDALILQMTARVGQIDVGHRDRRAGRSGYTYRKLLGVWCEALLGYSTLPFRAAMFVGGATAVWGAGALLFGLASQAIGDAGATTSGSAAITLLLGLILFYLGLLCECVVRRGNVPDTASLSSVRYVFRKADRHV